MDPESNLQNEPGRLLLRFKSICKPWRSFISDPRFDFLNTQSHPPRFISSLQSHFITSPTFGIKIDPNKTIAADDIFLDCCNGLFCMAGLSFTKDIVLWNPATKLFKLLPPSDAHLKDATVVSLGFGCNDKRDDFQVVRISRFKGNDMRVVNAFELYSSKSNSWRIIEAGFEFTVTDAHNIGKANGNPYWIACVDDDEDDDDDDDDDEDEDEDEEDEEDEDDVSHYRLFGFNATKTAFVIVPFPKEGIDAVESLVDWEGSLGALQCLNRDDGLLVGVDVLVYNDGERTWTNKVRLGPIKPLKLDGESRLHYSRSRQILGLCADGRMFIYDSKKRYLGLRVMNFAAGRYLWFFDYDETSAYVEGMEPFSVSLEGLDNGEFSSFEGYIVYSFNERTGEAAYYKA